MFLSSRRQSLVLEAMERIDLEYELTEQQKFEQSQNLRSSNVVHPSTSSGHPFLHQNRTKEREHRNGERLPAVNLAWLLENEVYSDYLTPCGVRFKSVCLCLVGTVIVTQVPPEWGCLRHVFVDDIRSHTCT
jgi:hypothetical protein